MPSRHTISVSVSAFLVATVVLFFSSTQKANAGFGFHGLYPHLAERPKQRSFSFPVVPYVGLRNVKNFGKLPKLFRAISGFSIPSSGLASLPELISDIKALYDSRLVIQKAVLPQVSFSWVAEKFELTFRGGVSNFTRSSIFALEDQIDFTNVYYYWDGTPYVRTTGPHVLQVSSITVIGGEFWGLYKKTVPISKKLRGTLLIGAGFNLGWRYDYQYAIRVAEEFSQNRFLEHEESRHPSVVGQLGMRIGMQIDGWSYLRPRFMLEVAGLISEDLYRLPTVSLGFSLGVWRLGTVDFSARDIGSSRPEIRFGMKKRFHLNSDVSLGGLINSRQFGGNLGYITVGIGGGKISKITLTSLFDKKQAGLMIGVKLGYLP